jgi:hypothetical protein
LAAPHTRSSDSYANPDAHSDRNLDADQNLNSYVYTYSDPDSDAYSD